jgi:tRNA 2-thiouridine synthesizing protein E
VKNFLEINGLQIEVDREGYLINRQDWSEEVCLAMAAADHCTLSDTHWQIIHFLRQYYEDYEHSPAMRVFIKALKNVIGPEQANSQALYELFPYGPARQATRYAGLPKPAHCI